VAEEGNGTICLVENCPDARAGRVALDDEWLGEVWKDKAGAVVGACLSVRNVVSASADHWNALRLRRLVRGAQLSQIL
jgi:hypothetical protein